MKILCRCLAIVIMVATILSCSKDNNDITTMGFSPELLNGTWRISLFTDESSNRTSEFNGYEFTFNVEQETAIVSYNGASQSTLVEVFQQDIEGEDMWVVYTDFDLDDLGNADLDDLVEDWLVTEVNSDATVISFRELYSNNTPEVLQLSKVSN